MPQISLLASGHLILDSYIYTKTCKRSRTYVLRQSYLLLVGDHDDLRAWLRQHGRRLQLRLLRLLRSGLLRLYLRGELGEDRVGLRLLPPEEPLLAST